MTKASSSAGPVAVPTPEQTNHPSAPDAITQQTPTPAAQAASFYSEGTLLQPNNQVRHDSVPRFDLQLASNIRAGWAASRGGRRSTTGRSAAPRAPAAEP